MNLADLMRALTAAGAPPEAVAIAVQAVEDARREALQIYPAKVLRSERNRRYYKKRLIKTSNKTPENVLKASESVLKTEAEDPPLARAFFVGEEVNIPPEKATLSTPKGDRPKSKRPIRLSENFTITPRMLAFATTAGLSEPQAAAEGAQMRDWSMSSPKGACFDWEARWRQWVRKAVERLPARGPPSSLTRNGKPSVQDFARAEDERINGVNPTNRRGEAGELCALPGGLFPLR